MIKIHGIKDQEVLVCQTKEEIASQAAKMFCDIVQRSIKEHGQCCVALSGGSTPKALYERLVLPDYKANIAWDKIHFFVSDERCVPLDSNESNFGTAQKLLFLHVNVNEKQLHPMQGQDIDPAECASSYETKITELVPVNENKLPCFDLIFLGMGPDGHTASLFPATQALAETKKLVVKNHVDKLHADRITFTFPLINNANNVIILVAGNDKAGVLAEVIQSKTNKYPVQQVQPCRGELLWLADRAAAEKLILPQPFS